MKGSTIKVVMGPLHPPISTYILEDDIIKQFKGRKQYTQLKTKNREPRKFWREKGEKAPHCRDALSQKKHLEPNPYLRQLNHFCHAFQITCQVLQPV